MQLSDNPSQLELTLPVLTTLDELGGQATPADVIEAVGEKLGVPAAVRHQSYVYDPDGLNRVRFPWRQKLHWVRLALVHRGLISAENRGIWKLTEKGQEGLMMAAPGTILVIYETPSGHALWAEAETAVGYIEKNSINLLFTSPPYPLQTPRAYGNKSEAEHIEWLVRMARDWRELLVDDGSMFLNMGSTWQKGMPTQSAYEERVLLALLDSAKFHLCQKLFWANPVKIPNSPWVTIRRERLNPSVEPIYWLGKNPHVKADNRRCLTSYKPDMLRRLERGKNYRKAPSGHLTSKNPFAKDNGGAIARTLIKAANSTSNDAYMKQCRAEGLPIHPARFPEDICSLAIKLTTDEGDICADFLSGSNVLGATAEKLNRRWISIEKSLLYGVGGRHRFKNVRLNPDLPFFHGAVAEARC